MLKIFLITLALLPQVLWAANIAQMGWPAVLTDLYQQLNQNPQKNYVVVVSRIPTKIIDFRSNNGIRNSIAKIGFAKGYHPGHVMIGWKCQIKNRPYVSFMGFNGENSEQMETMAQQGFGLNALLGIYTDGYIESPEKIQVMFDNVEQKYSDKSPEAQQYKFIGTTLEISENDCDQIINEINTYAGHEKYPKKYFSLSLNPDNYEGAACNSFTTHLLKQISSLQNISENFKRDLMLPGFLFRKPQPLPKDTQLSDQMHFVSGSKPLTPMGLARTDWSPTTADPHVKFHFVDSELILFWQKQFLFHQINQAQLLQTDEDNKLTKADFVIWKKMFERVFWERKPMLSMPEFEFNQWTRIDETLDQNTKNIFDQTQIMLKSKKISHQKFLYFPMTIVEN